MSSECELQGLEIGVRGTGVVGAFLSSRRFEQPAPFPLLPHDTTSWRVVELALRTPWYIVTLLNRHECCLRDLMVSHEQDLMDLLLDSEDELRAVHKISPPRRGHSEWSIESLTDAWFKKISQRIEDAGIHSAPALIVASSE